MRPFARAGLRLAPRSALHFAACLLAASTLSAGDGDLDLSWGGDGISASFGSSVPRSSGVAPDQQLYITGLTTQPDDSEFEWWRNDNSGGGQWLGESNAIPFLDNFDILEVLFDSSDRLLFAGTTTVFGTETVQRAFVARFESFTDGESGTLDTTFSGAGWAIFDDAPYCDTEDCRLIDIEESRDATTKYIALLERVTGVVTADYFLVGLTAAGALDANFGIDGLAYVPAPELALTGAGADLVVDSQNRPYVHLSFFDPDASGDLDTVLARFDSDGDLDPTFPGGGLMLIDTGDALDSVSGALAIGSDGRIGVAALRLDGDSSFVRVFDRTFALSAQTTVSPADVGALAFDGLGRLLYGWDSAVGDGAGLGRLLVQFGVGLESDDTFGQGGSRFFDIDAGGANGETPLDIEFPAGRPLLLVEADQAGSGKQTNLVRFETALVFE
ncbi:MAG: hypothetical protein QG573_2484, partial [Acidobacteriota bacterium]|nr:hypothetical protein [Acidobacteriota bacterium]